MNTDYFKKLYRYTDWANRKVWALADTMSDEDYFKPLDFSIGSIHDQLVHTMGVEFWWLHALRTGELKYIDDPAAFPNLSYVVKQWEDVSKTNLAYVNSLTEDELQRRVNPESWENERSVYVWEALVQVANHSTDHRAQIMAMMHQFGVTGVEQDFLFFLHDADNDA